MGVFFGLFNRVRHGDDNVAEQLRAGVVVNVVHAVNTQRERQHIRRHILVTVLMIQAADFLIVHKTDADFRGPVEPLVDKHRRTATAHEHTHARGDFNLFLVVGDDDLHFFNHRLLLASSFFSYALTIS
ncbi:hypothetical protein SDC9_207980 [bioreactor metagenome]|uniref:Uncharacterized protein n=1 Tax=bioreactor metagenome TaxID=1076179 RepID=A0A645JIU1_9ZZZZ